MNCNLTKNKEMNDCNRNQTIRELSEHSGFSLKEYISKFEDESFEERLAFFENNIFNKLKRNSPYETIRSVCIAELSKYINHGHLKMNVSPLCETETLKDWFHCQMTQNVELLLDQMAPDLQELYYAFETYETYSDFEEFNSGLADDLAILTNPF